MHNKHKQIFALVFILAVATVHGATVIWNGPATTNTVNNWSNGGNWLGGVAPAATDDVKFFDLGAVPGTIPNITNINNTVDVNTTNGWVLYGNTNGFHPTLVADGVTLTINSNLDVGTLIADTTPARLTHPSPVQAAQSSSTTPILTWRQNKGEWPAHGPLWILQAWATSRPR